MAVERSGHAWLRSVVMIVYLIGSEGFSFLRGGHSFIGQRRVKVTGNIYWRPRRSKQRHISAAVRRFGHYFNLFCSLVK